MAIVASIRVKKLEQGSQKINNIGRANMVILKRLREKIRSNYTYPVTATKSQKLVPTKISKLKIFRPTSLVMELLPKIIASILSLFLPISKDDNMKNSVIVHGCRYKLGGVSFLSKEKHIQFDKEDDKIFDIAKLICYQKLILTKTQL